MDQIAVTQRYFSGNELSSDGHVEVETHDVCLPTSPVPRRKRGCISSAE
jgi:hypothetical protein